ncbi:MAG TPA: phosphonate ABC transporter ATP-binding protein, partial [Alicyclobacillus sp.]|nr:phosphonate ABC transporter ATP-binding protein [Alicyclobacillus sp.]
ATRIIGIHRGTKVFDGPPSKLDDRIIGQIYYQEKAVV